MEEIKYKDKVEELKRKYSSYWYATEQGDSFFGFHGFVDAMLLEAIKYGVKCGDMHALDYTLIHFGNEEALKNEIKKLRTELKNEERSHTYWREEYYKLIDKEIEK